MIRPSMISAFLDEMEILDGDIRLGTENKERTMDQTKGEPHVDRE